MDEKENLGKDYQAQDGQEETEAKEEEENIKIG